MIIFCDISSLDMTHNVSLYYNESSYHRFKINFFFLKKLWLQLKLLICHGHVIGRLLIFLWNIGNLLPKVGDLIPINWYLNLKKNCHNKYTRVCIACYVLETYMQKNFTVLQSPIGCLIIFNCWIYYLNSYTSIPSHGGCCISPCNLSVL